MNVLCIVVDGLQPAYLGSYGNGWVETPHFDRLAAEGFVFDQAFVGSPRLASFHAGAWHGLSTSAPPAAHEKAISSPASSLPAMFRAAGYRTVLLTDEPRLNDLAAADAFEDRVVLEAKPDSQAPSQTAEDDESTATAELFAAALEILDGKSLEDDAEPREASPPLPSPHLLWIHARGFSGPWDAPLERRTRYADEEDPEPLEFAAPPHQRLAAEPDPDYLWGIRQAYAAQVTLLDDWLGVLLDWLDTSPGGKDTLVCVLSARGYPLGVHGQLGYPADDAPTLYSEATQLAWLLRFPERACAAGRTNALVEPADLPATLAQICGLPAEGWASQPQAGGSSLLDVVREAARRTRDRLFFSANTASALRTGGWYLISRPNKAGEGEPGLELYAKPDDRWEVNEVAARCPGVVEKLTGLLSEQQQLAAGEVVELTPLDEELDTGLS